MDRSLYEQPLDDDERRFLAAVVSTWLYNGQHPMDGPNSPRRLLDGDTDAQGPNSWESAFETCATLCDAGLLRREAHGGQMFVTPTAQGIHEVLKPQLKSDDD